MAASNKTVESDASVEDFLARVEPTERAADAHALIDVMRQVSGLEPKLWGPSIVGFGSVHYRYESGREGDTPAIAFAPRKAELVLYVGASTPNIAALLPGLGKHRTGKGCLYVKRLADVDAAVLTEIVQTAWDNRIASAA
ncbi:DUF1801 domain-containing protein [Sphingomonas echinoides]|uniref:DUF1801 domain-containing protein n=1 Tax=Sphingomonas echinoides TaxID=59803 RepID=A0ABU4PGH8_9SPHN|nr:DUF1801 domain-containing protein [Sphingomonas echinoides]MDX5983313.1 DUF1801 domain-containing protein [Sphingomonas echinoides]